MGELFTWPHLIVLAVVALFFLLPIVLYILTLQGALKKCAPTSRTIEPGLMWLYLIPFVNMIFNFFIVLGMAKTLRNEFYRRGIPVTDQTPGQSIGIAMAVCLCCSIIPIVGLVAGLAHLILWIIYWVKIAGYSRTLDMPPQFVPANGV